MNTTSSTGSMPTLDELNQIARAFREMRQQGIERGVKVARGIRCKHGCAAAYTDKPSEGFVVCEHVVEELRRRVPRAKHPTDYLAPLGGLAIYLWAEWCVDVPPGQIAGLGELGQLTWIERTT